MFVRNFALLKCAQGIAAKAHSLIIVTDEMGRGLVANSPTQLEFTEAGCASVVSSIICSFP
jgi:adenosyl cobinamide kinase/adenosyl cobinamide phosphate guanylyltransferase